jgi:2-methylcitrate dehydratase
MGVQREENSLPPIAVQLAVFADGLRYDRLPSEVIMAVKRLLVDSLGCALGAFNSEPLKLVTPIAPSLGTSQKGATLFGQGRRSTAEGASIVNGTLLRYLDFMDVYWAKDVCHPSENIPPALACVEEANGSGRDLIEAVLTGYEVQLRLCDAFSFENLGFHHVSAAGFVVPFIAGKAWHQPPAIMAHGSVLGGVRHMTLQALSRGKLSMAKAIGYAMNGAESITMARLAGAGLTGPLSTYEWLFKMGSPAVFPTLALDLDSFNIERVSLKQYPVQFNLQAPVVAAIRLHRDLRDRLGDIRRIVVMVKQESLARTAQPEKFHPTDRETADHSLPACVAMALLDGRLTPAQFEAERFSDQDVIALISKTEAMVGPGFEERFPHGRPGAVEVYLSDGSRHEAVEESAFGDSDRPLDQAALHEKFLSLATPKVGQARAWRIVEIVNSLETLSNLNPLMNELSGPW